MRAGRRSIRRGQRRDGGRGEPAGGPRLPLRRAHRQRLEHHRLLGVARVLRPLPAGPARAGDRGARRQFLFGPPSFIDLDVSAPSGADGAGRRAMGLNLAFPLLSREAPSGRRMHRRSGSAILSLATANWMTPQLLAGRSRLPGLRRGSRAGRPGRGDAGERAGVRGRLLWRAPGGGVVVPMNVLLKPREVASTWRTPAPSAARLARLLRGGRDGAADAGAELIEVEPAAFAALLAGAEPDTGSPRPPRRHRGDPLHLGHDRQAEGRRVTHANLVRNVEGSAPQPVPTRPGRTGSSARCRFPFFGQTGGLERRGFAGRPRRTLMPEVQPRQGPGDHRAGPAYGLRGRADDVRPGRFSSTPSASASTSPHSASASPALPRCRSRSCALRRRFGVTYSRATASPRPRVASFNRPERERKPGRSATRWLVSR